MTGIIRRTEIALHKKDSIGLCLGSSVVGLEVLSSIISSWFFCTMVLTSSIVSNSLASSFLKMGSGHPWWYSGLESACQCRGHGFDPWSRKIPHAEEQQSLCTTTSNPTSCNYWTHVLQPMPVCLEPVLHNKRSHCNEKPMHCSEE